MTFPPSTPPTLTQYTEERFVRELLAIKGFTDVGVEASLRWARQNDRLFTTSYNSSFTGGCVAYCPTCDRMRVNDGPDSYAYRCRTCGTSTGRSFAASEFASFRSPLVKVKPLVWQDRPDGWHADVGHGRCYHICAPWRPDNHFMLNTEAMEMATPTHVSTSHPTLEAAQAAAQEEWTRFILAAIESPSP